MDLQQEWQNMNAEIIAKTPKNEFVSTHLDVQSTSLMQDLLFKLKWKLRWVRIIDVPILAAALFVKGDLKILLIAIFVIYEFFRAFGIREFHKIKTSVDYDSNTKQLLENNLKATKKMLKMENIFGYIFLPISGPIGWLACKLFFHKSFETVFNLPHFFLQLGLFVLVGIPFIFLAKKMNDSIFKKQINNLDQKIKELSI